MLCGDECDQTCKYSFLVKVGCELGSFVARRGANELLLCLLLGRYDVADGIHTR